MKTGAVIVAAGAPSGAASFEPTRPIGSISAVRRIISTLQQAGVDPIVLVTGNRADELGKHVSKWGVICLRNEDYEHTEMFDSAKIGLAYLAGKCDQILFTPVDIPLFTVGTVRRLIESGSRLASPTYHNRAGHPLLLSADMIERILAYRGGGGLRAAVLECGLPAARIPVDDAGVLFDADAPGDYRELLREHNVQMFRPLVRVELAREEAFFGPGTAMLLRLIESTGSVRVACLLMNLSYSKSWKMINRMEREIGYPVLIRRQGGSRGGNSVLTERGRAMLEAYEQFEKEVADAAQVIFQRRFGA